MLDSSSLREGAWGDALKERLEDSDDVDYVLWRSAGHYDHLHVSFTEYGARNGDLHGLFE